MKGIKFPVLLICLRDYNITVKYNGQHTVASPFSISRLCEQINFLSLSLSLSLNTSLHFPLATGDGPSGTVQTSFPSKVSASRAHCKRVVSTGHFLAHLAWVTLSCMYCQ